MAAKARGRHQGIPETAYGMVFKLRANGLGARRIATLLEEEGVFTTKSTVDWLLHG